MKAELGYIGDQLKTLKVEKNNLVRVLYPAVYNHHGPKFLPPKFLLDDMNLKQSANIQEMCNQIVASGNIPVFLFRTHMPIPLSWNVEKKELTYHELKKVELDDWLATLKKCVMHSEWTNDVRLLGKYFEDELHKKLTTARMVISKRVALDKVALAMIQLMEVINKEELEYRDARLVMEAYSTVFHTFGRNLREHCWYTEEQKESAIIENNAERDAFMQVLKPYYRRIKTDLIREFLVSVGTELFDEFTYVYPLDYHPPGTFVRSRYKLFSRYIEYLYATENEIKL